MNDSDYVMLLILGTAIVMLDGQILYHSGKRYLGGTGGDESTASMTRLVVVLFHLVALGILALISTIDIGGVGLQAIVMRLGVVLLVVAIFHGAALAVLTRMRESRQVESHRRQTEQRLQARGEHERQTRFDSLATPVAGQNGAMPEVTPGIEANGPYSTSQ